MYDLDSSSKCCISSKAEGSMFNPDNKTQLLRLGFIVWIKRTFAVIDKTKLWVLVMEEGS